MVELVDKSPEELQLVACHGYGLDHITVEKQHAAGKIDGGDAGNVDEIAAPHAIEGRRHTDRSITRCDCFVEDGKCGEMGTNLSIAVIEIGVISIGLEINNLLEIDDLNAVT